MRERVFRLFDDSFLRPASVTSGYLFPVCCGIELLFVSKIRRGLTCSYPALKVSKEAEGHLSFFPCGADSRAPHRQSCAVQFVGCIAHRYRPCSFQRVGRGG